MTFRVKAKSSSKDVATGAAAAAAFKGDEHVFRVVVIAECDAVRIPKADTLVVVLQRAIAAAAVESFILPKRLDTKGTIEGLSWV
jgi:hypothetical protein